MSATYDPELSSPRDRARRQLGDVGRITDSAGSAVWLMPNETLDALIAREGFAEGLAVAADSLRAEYSHEPDYYEDESGVRLQWRQRFTAWKDLASRMRDNVARNAGTVAPNRIVSGRLDNAGEGKLR